MMQGSLGERMQALRVQRGLNLTEAAELVGVGRDTLSYLESGSRRTSMTTLHKIAEGYGIPVESLLAEPPQYEGAERAVGMSDAGYWAWLRDAPAEDIHAIFATGLADKVSRERQQLAIDEFFRRYPVTSIKSWRSMLNEGEVDPEAGEARDVS